MNKLLGLITFLIVIQHAAHVSALSQSDLIIDINRYRAAHGKPALTINSNLMRSAKAKAQDMCRKNYWSHGDWQRMIRGSGYKFSHAGENLAYGFVSSQDVVSGWAASPSHQRNMVGDYSEMGLAVVTCSQYQGGGQSDIVVNHLGKR